MSSVPLTPAVTPGDRLGMMLFLGAMLHGLLILGISFATPEPDKTDPLPTLDIILVQSKSIKAPEKVDYLAQANQQGGGTLEEKTHPSKPVKGPSPVPNNSVSQVLSKPAPQKKIITAEKKHVTSTAGRDIILSRPNKKPEKEIKEINDTRRLVSRSLEIASLTEEINRKIQHYASRPRKKHINASTREFAPAAYMDAWTRKVERIGNLNYPDEARRQKLSGILQLTVGINRDGSVHSIILKQSSGHPVLDDAAKRVVRLGAPYAKIPDSIREAGEPVDILYITRTWEFSSTNTWHDRGS